MNRPVRKDPLVRFLGVAAFLTVPATLTLLGAAGATHDGVRALARYSPERLVHGAVWTLPFSALLLPNVRMLGPTTVFTIAFLVPYALIRGPVRAIAVFFAGHLIAILAVAVVAEGGHALEWSPVAPLYRHAELGAAAGLAAVVGGLAGALITRSRIAGVMVMAGAAACFLVVLACSSGVLRGVAAAQQLLALGVGLIVERRWDRAGHGA